MKLCDSSFLSDSSTTWVLDCAVSFLGVVLFFYESSKYFMAEQNLQIGAKGANFEFSSNISVHFQIWLVVEEEKWWGMAHSTFQQVLEN